MEKNRSNRQQPNDKQHPIARDPTSGAVFRRMKDIRDMSEKAIGHFGLDKIHEKRVLIFESSSPEFLPGVFNSPYKERILEAINKGRIITLNHDLIEQMGSTHSYFHAALHRVGIRAPPSIVMLLNPQDPRSTMGPIFPVGMPLPNQPQMLWVKKISYMLAEDGGFLDFAHRGRGVSLLLVKSREAAEQIIPKHTGEFFQQFVWPPDNIIRDIRVYLAGGRAIAGSIRRAREALTKQHELGEAIPSGEYYPSAEHPGTNEILDGELKERCFALAQRIHTAIDEYVKQRKCWIGTSSFSYGSIDFLLDRNGEPLPIEFDTHPSVTSFQSIDGVVAESLAAHIARLSGFASDPRPEQTYDIHFYGTSGRFAGSVLDQLRATVPPEKLTVKPSLSEVMRVP